MPAQIEIYLNDGTLNLDTNSKVLLQGASESLQIKSGYGNYNYGHTNLLGTGYGMTFGERSINADTAALDRINALSFSDALTTARAADGEVVYLSTAAKLCMANADASSRRMYFNFCGSGLFTNADDKYLTIYDDSANHAVMWSLGGLGRAPRVVDMIKLTSVNSAISSYTSKRGKKVNIMLDNIPGQISDSGEGVVGISGLIAKWSNGGKTVQFYGYDSYNGQVANRINKMGHVPVYIIEFDNDY